MPVVFAIKSALFVTTMSRSERFWGDGSENEHSFDTIKDDNGKRKLNISR